MKANELMIGDFVTRQNYENKDVVCKIIGLSKNSISVEFDNGSRSMGASEDSISPIPLTPEILEKNGFNIEITPYTPDWKRCILNPNFFLEDRLKGFYHFNGNNLAKIQYVHELQHALKLCGIEKQIEL